MTLPRIGPLVAASVLLGACAQLIGLNKFDSTDGTAGEAGAPAAGKGGKGGSGGTGGVDGGRGGSANGPSAGGAAGSQAGRGTGGAGGSSASGGKGGTDTGGVAGAEGGAGPMGGKGGSGGGKGGAGGKGGTGTAGDGGAGGGASGCSSTLELTTHGTPTPYLESIYTSYEYNVDPQVDTAASDYLWIDLYTTGEYDGELVGQTFQLGTGADENYASCSRCVWFGVDVGDSGYADSYFYAKSGSMQVAADSEQMNGFPNVHLTDVTLSEVTLDSDTHVSTEIPGGRCLHLASADLVIASNVPSGWTCPDYGYGDNLCDCGCGVPDIDCTTGLVGECEYCVETGSCGDYGCVNIDLTDNSQCVAGVSNGWSCEWNYYGDSLCDCGCGVVDYDCFSADAADCEFCADTGSCTTATTSDCTAINPTDNSQCQ